VQISSIETKKAGQCPPFVFGEKIDDHVLVNNWANGWAVDKLTVDKSDKVTKDNMKIVIVYWSQYLQYIGFVLLFLTPLLIRKYSK
jgi:hypothetical protein